MSRARSRIIGGRSRQLPCGHGRALAPELEGRHERRCDVCRARYVLVVEKAADSSVKCGQLVLRAAWQSGGPT